LKNVLTIVLRLESELEEFVSFCFSIGIKDRTLTKKLFSQIDAQTQSELLDHKPYKLKPSRKELARLEIE
jgi:hypothetical protein